MKPSWLLASVLAIFCLGGCASHPDGNAGMSFHASRAEVLANRTAGTAKAGVRVSDPRWEQFGDYLNEVIERVDHEWHGNVDASNVHVKPKSHVEVTFTLNAEGEVKVKSVENYADDVAVSQCTRAITNPAPYRKWTREMVATLGREQSLAFAFYYY